LFNFILLRLRESIITFLEWTQIDLQRKTCWIHPDQAKSSKAIGIPLNENAVSVLRGNIGKHHYRVFTHEGKPFAKAGTKTYKNILERAGINKFRFKTHVGELACTSWNTFECFTRTRRME